MSENVYQSPQADLQIEDGEVSTLTTQQLFFSFKGRIRRGQFWFANLMLMVVTFAAVFILAMLGLGEGAFSIVLLLFYIPIVWASLAIQAKRWHDRNKSGWWILINLVPVIGGFWALIETGFLTGDGYTNNYGPQPL